MFVSSSKYFVNSFVSKFSTAGLAAVMTLSVIFSSTIGNAPASFTAAPVPTEAVEAAPCDSFVSDLPLQAASDPVNAKQQTNVNAIFLIFIRNRPLILLVTRS